MKCFFFLVSHVYGSNLLFLSSTILKKKMKLKVDELNSKGSQHQVGNSKNFLELKIFNVKYEQKNLYRV